MERILRDLLTRLQKAYGERLVSVILYGSGAVGDHNGHFSDLNILCVLSEVTLRELADSVAVFRWWRGLHNPSPLLLSRDELRNSTDCFPIEFHDIRERHRILYGEDVVADLDVDKSFYRAHVEYQLRSKLLRLRQKAAAVLNDKDLLRDLLADSISTFCVLFRHALLLSGVDAGFAKREVVNQVREHFGIDVSSLERLLDLREGKIKPRQVDVVPLCESYLKVIQAVVDRVDRLEK
jgi:predicted nucleotidyltransferase